MCECVGVWVCECVSVSEGHVFHPLFLSFAKLFKSVDRRWFSGVVAIVCFYPAIAPESHRNRTGIAPELHRIWFLVVVVIECRFDVFVYCTEIALELHWNCPGIDWSQFFFCGQLMPFWRFCVLHWNCTVTALELHWNCTGIALELPRIWLVIIFVVN